MLSQEQLMQVISENESLRVQLEELNHIISLREEELGILKEDAATASELRSMLDLQLDELHTMQNYIGKKNQQAEGAAEREFELEQELTGVAKLQQQYNELVQQYTYAQAQLFDIQTQLSEMSKKNRLLEQIAAKVGELESHLANTLSERDELITKIETFNNTQLSEGS